MTQNDAWDEVFPHVAEAVVAAVAAAGGRVRRLPLRHRLRMFLSGKRVERVEQNGRVRLRVRGI